MTTKERLKQYIEKDEIYQNYKQNKLINSNDFDKFCIQHCKDIEELLDKNLELEQALDKIEKYVIENSQYWDETGLRYWKDKKDEPHDILEIIQKYNRR